MIRKPDGSIILESLDEILLPEECAVWLRLEPEALNENVRAQRIEAMKINSRVHRFHPRAVLVGLGVPREVLPQHLEKPPVFEKKPRNKKP